MTATAYVLFNYDAVEADELTISKGQDVNVLETYDDGWWLVKRKSSVGLVPSNYLSLEQPTQSPPHTTPGPLPPGWLSAVDPDSSETYYYNTSFGHVQWEFPSSGPMPSALVNGQSSVQQVETASVIPKSPVTKEVKRLIDLREKADAKLSALR